MTSTTSCETLRDDIIALLYDDGELAERMRARDHLATCVPCRSEYADFKGLRKVLGGWSLPEPVSPPRTRAAWGPWVPASLAAAAGLLLGIGVALAGRSAFPSAGGSTAVLNPSTAQQFVSHDQLQELLKSQEDRHQAEIAELRRTVSQVADSSVPTTGSLQNISNLSPTTIEKLLKASEDRQVRRLEARLAGLRTESDMQRQYDMAQIAAGLAYIDSRTGADAARTSELMKNLVRVTAKPQDR